MTFSEYEAQAALTRLPQKAGIGHLAHNALGITSEAGEVANDVKKAYRDFL